MALPVGLATVAVTGGPYLDTVGAVYTGWVAFKPSTVLVYATTGAVIIDGEVHATVDSSGNIAVTLPATDATGLTSTGFTYAVSFHLKSATGDRAEILPVTIQLPSSAPTVDLDLLSFTDTSTGVTVGLPSVVSVAGLSGAVSVAALRTALGLGSAAYVSTTAFDAAGAATAAQAAAVALSAQRASNLSDLVSASSARTNLGLGTAAVQPSTAFDPAGAAAAMSIVFGS